MARCLLSFLVLAPPLAFAQTDGQGLLNPPADLGGTVKCPSKLPAPTITLTIPQPLYERAKVKARLAELLKESLDDDSKNIVNVAREKELKKLLNELRR